MADNAVAIQVTGAEEVARQLARLAHDADNMQAVFQAVANQIATEARTLAPRRTGALAASVIPSATRHGGGITSSLSYSAPIHWGWRRRNIEPSLFMKRAADPKGGLAADKLAAQLQRYINQNGLG